MNPVAGQIQKGLDSWKKLGAKIAYLVSANKKVPKIWLGSNKSSKVIIIASGLHLEETSGPSLLLEPTALSPILQPTLEKDINFLIYPVINQFGLSYLPTNRRKFLRYNEEGINYNDGWGIPEKKSKEVELVEKDILDTKNTKEIIFAISLHEDSETPGKGYVYTNAVKSRDFRAKLIKGIKSKINVALLATKQHLLEANEPTFQGGVIEEEFCIVDAKDPGSMENWLADDLGVPTVLSEGPFGLPLKVRKEFQLVVIESIVSLLQ